VFEKAGCGVNGEYNDRTYRVRAGMSASPRHDHLKSFKGSNLTVGSGTRGRARKRPTRTTASSAYVFEGGSPKADEYPEFAPTEEFRCSWSGSMCSKGESTCTVQGKPHDIPTVEPQQNPVVRSNSKNTGPHDAKKKKKKKDLFPAWEDPALGLEAGVANLALVKHVPLDKREGTKWSLAKRFRHRLSRRLRQSTVGKTDLFPSWEDPAIAPANDIDRVEYVLHEYI